MFFWQCDCNSCACNHRVFFKQRRIAAKPANNDILAQGVVVGWPCSMTIVPCWVPHIVRSNFCICRSCLSNALSHRPGPPAIYITCNEEGGNCIDAIVAWTCCRTLPAQNFSRDPATINWCRIRQCACWNTRAALAHALQRRWGQMLTIAANTALSSSLLELPATAVPGGGGLPPPLADVLADARWT